MENRIVKEIQYPDGRREIFYRVQDSDKTAASRVQSVMIDPPDREALEKVPEADANIAAGNLAKQLRFAGAAYHLACKKWLEKNTDKTEADFDALSPQTKEHLMFGNR